MSDAAEYDEIKQAAQEAIQVFAERITPDRKVQVMVNTADQAKRGDYYLTVTGTSAEMGDDGEVGRGNRASGLITPMRSASLEAPCGKNPISHVGKVYNALALDTCRDICNRVPQVKEVTMQVLSQIGHPIDQPLVCNALVRTKTGVLSEDTRHAITTVIDEHLAGISDVRVKIRTGRLDEAQHILEAWAESERAQAEHGRVRAPRAHRETVLLLSLVHALWGKMRNGLSGL